MQEATKPKRRIVTFETPQPAFDVLERVRKRKGEKFTTAIILEAVCGHFADEFSDRAKAHPKLARFFTKEVA